MFSLVLNNKLQPWCKSKDNTIPIANRGAKEKLKFFYFCLNKYIKLVKVSICLWGTRWTFTNYSK